MSDGETSEMLLILAHCNKELADEGEINSSQAASSFAL